MNINSQSNTNVAQCNSSLARKSYELYEAIANDYLSLDKHWGEDLDIIVEAIGEKGKVAMLDAGCGPGWHICRCLEVFGNKIERIVGLDFSKNMLEYASDKLNKSFYKTRNF